MEIVDQLEQSSTSISISNDGMVMAAGTSTGKVLIYQYSLEKDSFKISQEIETDFRKEISSLEFILDKILIVSSTASATVKVYSLANSKSTQLYSEIYNLSDPSLKKSILMMTVEEDQ